MHSRIYQLTTTPVQQGDYITEDFFYEHWFIGNIADYVDDEVDRNADLKSLRERLAGIAVFETIDSFKVLPGGKEMYFAKAYKSFIAARDKTLDMGLSEFASGGFNESVYNMKRAHCTTFEVYVSSDEFDTIPLDDFIRHAEVGRLYHIGATLDYHF